MAKRLADLTRTLTANGGQDVAVAGEFIFLKSATGSMHVIIDGATLALEAGDSYETGDPFTGFRIEDTSGAGNTVELVVGFGAFERNVVTGSITNAVDVATADNLRSANGTSCVAGALTDLYTGAADDRYIIIHHPQANVNTMRIGGGTTQAAAQRATATRGFELLPGESVVLEGNTLNVGVWNTNDNAGGNETLTVTRFGKI